MTTRWHDADSVSMYVAGTMAGDDIDEFEQHLLECTDCRAAVRSGAATRVALVTAASDRRTRRQDSLSPAGRRVRRGLMMAGGIAAMILAFVAVRQRDTGYGGLEVVVPPEFAAAPVRSADDSTVRLVDMGMTAYTAADYARAADLLGRASAADSSPGVTFFLGAALLMEGKHRDAIAALRRVVMQDSPYAMESRVLIAKAFLRLGRVDSALSILGPVSDDASGGSALRALADSIRAVARPR